MLNFCMKVGLLGEKLQIYTASGSSKVKWESFLSSTKPLTWYKVYYQLSSFKFVVPFFPQPNMDIEGNPTKLVERPLCSSLSLPFIMD